MQDPGRSPTFVVGTMLDRVNRAVFKFVVLLSGGFCCVVPACFSAYEAKVLRAARIAKAMRNTIIHGCNCRAAKTDQHPQTSPATWAWRHG